MNWTIDITWVFILLAFICIAVLIRYALIWRLYIRNSQVRLEKIEDEIQRHPLTCPARIQAEKLAEKQAAVTTTEQILYTTQSLQTHQLTYEEEENFRQSFISSHPVILHRLRTLCPKVTRTDELLCILIILKRSNEEIARILGISRSSVLKNRYRLRVKLKLPEGSDLDAEIFQLLCDTE